MTKKTVCNLLGYKSWDSALPQSWFNWANEKLKAFSPDNNHPWSHFVWLYSDKHGSYGAMGMPAPISSIGRAFLKKEYPNGFLNSLN